MRPESSLLTDPRAATTRGSCRLCGGEAAPHARRSDVALLRCARCGFVSGFPTASVPTDVRYQHLYAGQPAPAPEARYHEWLAHAERRVGTGRMLEIGAGAGALVSVARRRGWVVDATEVSASAVQRLTQTGARVHVGDLDDARYPDGAFDLVACLEVIEHLPSPARCLRETARIVRPGGLLLLTTPNYHGLSRRLLGVRWRVIDPEHLAYFTPRTLGEALRLAGYREVRVKARSLDLSTWRRGRGDRVAAFDPHASARIRDGVESSILLRAAKHAVNAALGLTGLGDSLLSWARR